MHGSSHTLLLVCLSQEVEGRGESGFSILTLSNRLCSPCLSVTQLPVIPTLLTMQPATTQKPGATADKTVLDHIL